MNSEWNILVTTYHGGEWVDKEYASGEEICFVLQESTRYCDVELLLQKMETNSNYVVLEITCPVKFLSSYLQAH